MEERASQHGSITSHENERQGSSTVFAIAVSAVQVLGLLVVIVVGVWMGHYRGGFAWDGSAKEFNYHPVCMVIAFVFLYSEAVLVYRVFRHEKKFTIKIIHMALQLAALIIASVGLKAVFDFHNHNNIPNLYSLHSWVGLATFILFSLQFLFGFMMFLWPKFNDRVRSAYLRVHVFFGMFIFFMAVASCLMGITEKLLFSMLVGPVQSRLGYSKGAPEGILANCLGVAIILMAGIVAYLVSNPSYRRPQTQEYESLLLRNDDSNQ